MADPKHANDEGAKLQAAVAAHEKEGLKLKQQLNKHQAIPRSSTGETHPLGNAPTPDPIEPNVMEPGNVFLQTPAEPAAPAAAGAPKPPASGSKPA